MIQRARCGCLGFLVNEREFLCIQACDEPIHSSGEYGLWYRPVNETQLPFTSLTEEEERKIWSELGKLIVDGYKLRTIQFNLERR